MIEEPLERERRGLSGDAGEGKDKVEDGIGVIGGG